MTRRRRGGRPGRPAPQRLPGPRGQRRPTARRFLYGDRHQYTKMATLFTHTGLVLFLVAAAVTSRLGDEQGLVVPEGESLTVQPIGTPGPAAGQEPRLRGARASRPARRRDFTTDLAVYQDGREIARKTIRVNDPLVDRRLHVPPERVRARAVPRRPRRGRPAAVGRRGAADRRRRGSPYGILASRAATSGCSCSSARPTTGRAIVLVLPYRVIGQNAGRDAASRELRAVALAQGRDPRLGRAAASRVELRDVGEYTLLIAKRDPGQGIVWLAFGSLIAGITITFYLPRRRVWTRLTADGRLGDRLAVGPLRRRRARVRPAARRPRRGPPAGMRPRRRPDPGARVVRRRHR